MVDSGIFQVEKDAVKKIIVSDFFHILYFSIRNELYNVDFVYK